MTLSAELILAVITIIFVVLAIKEYAANGQMFTPKLKTWLRLIVIFLVVEVALYLLK